MLNVTTEAAAFSERTSCPWKVLGALNSKISAGVVVHTSVGETSNRTISYNLKSTLLYQVDASVGFESIMVKYCKTQLRGPWRPGAHEVVARHLQISPIR